MIDLPIVFTIFLIFTGAALLSTLALYTRQSLLVAYILIGCILGSSGLGLVSSHGHTLKSVGAIGIFFLLFLLGLDLQPKKFLHALRKTAPVTVITSIIFMIAGYVIAIFFGFSQMESLIVGVSMMFSSTIIALKLMPTTILHHRHTGELMISILLSQDLIAIVVLVLLSGVNNQGFSLMEFVELSVAFPLLLGVAYVIERFVLTPCLKRFDSTHEYVFLVAVGWCLGLAQLAHWMGLSEEIGAFVAGFMLANSPVAHYLVESLKPLRDFFLVMFFFSIGAEFDFSYLPQIVLPALLLAAIMLGLKPYLFGKFLQRAKEPADVSFEIGVRLGQGSEFSLLLMTVALEASMIQLKTAYLVQAAMIITFIVSSYWVVLKYPTPMALSSKSKLQKD